MTTQEFGDSTVPQSNQQDERYFWHIWAIQAVSTAGSIIASFALSLAVWEATASAALLSWVTAAATAGIIYCAPLAALVVNRWGHRRAAMAAAAVGAVTSGSLAMVASRLTAEFPVVIALIFIASLASSVNSITLVSSIRLMRAERNLMRINGIIGMLDHAPTLLGPVLGAAAYPLVGVCVLYVADALTFVLCLAVIRWTGWGAGLEQDRRHEDRSLRAGLAFIAAHRPLRNVQLLYLVLNVCNGMAGAAIVACLCESAKLQAGEPQWWLAAAQTAGALGALSAGALVIGCGDAGGRLVFFSGGLAIASLIGRCAPAALPLLPVWCAAMFGRNAGLQLNGTALGATWQELTPPALQASVAGVRKITGQGLYPVATLCGGGLATFLQGAMTPFEANRDVVVVSGAMELLTLAVFLLVAANRRLFDRPDADRVPEVTPA